MGKKKTPAPTVPAPTAPMAGISKLASPGEGLADGRYSFEHQTYSPEVQAYLDKLEAAAKEKGDGYYSAIVPQGELYNGDVNIPVYATDAYLRQFIDQPVEQNLGYQFDVGGKWGSTGQFSAGPGTKVALVDDKTGELIYSGVGFEGAEEARRIATERGGSSAWSMYAAPEGTDDYYKWSQNEPQQGVVSGIGQLIATVGPIVLGAAMAPATMGGAAGGAGAGGAGAGASTGSYAWSAAGGPLGSLSAGAKAALSGALAATGGTLQGNPLDEIAIKTALAAGGTYIAAEYGDEIKAALDKITGATGTTGGIGEINNITGAADNPYNVDLTDAMNFNYGTPDLTGIGGGGGGGGGIGGLDGPDTVVTGTRPDTIGTTPVVTGPLEDFQITNELPKDEAVVTGRKEDPITVPPVVTGPLEDFQITNELPEDEAVVEGKPDEPITIPTVPVTIPDTGNLPFDSTDTEIDVDTPDLDKKWYEKLSVADWIKLITTGIGIGDGVFGDDGDDGPPVGTSTNDTPVDYDAAVASGARHQRPVTFNPFTYGQPQGDQPTQFQFFEEGPGAPSAASGIAESDVGWDGGNHGQPDEPVAAAEGGEPSLLERAAQEYPFLKRYNPVVVQGIGEGESETWRPKEPGDKMHPRPPTIPIDRLGFEFYGEPTNQGLAGEAMHIDRKANHVREKLRDTMTPEQIERLKQESGDYKMSVERGMSEDAAIKNALDGAVRGYVIGQWPADANERMGYTEKQRKELDKLKRYVTGAKDHAEGGGIGEMERHAQSYAQGGGHEGEGPVAGIGGGQEDKIPAWLSDGEYVWSAQDVSDLGDGSTNEGVRRLDKMRQQVRRQAGRKDVKKIAKPQAGIGDLMAGAV